MNMAYVMSSVESVRVSNRRVCVCVCEYRNYGIKQITRHIKFISLSSNKGVIQGRMIICAVPASPCFGTRKHMLKPTENARQQTMDKYEHTNSSHTINRNMLARARAYTHTTHRIASLHGRETVFSSYFLSFFFSPHVDCRLTTFAQQ